MPPEAPADRRHRRTWQGHPGSGDVPLRAGGHFGQAVGMLPLTGTSAAEHMKQDLASRDLALSSEEVRTIESLTG